MLSSILRHLLQNSIRNQIKDSNLYMLIWVKVFENGPSKICGRQPLQNLNWYNLLRQTISLQIEACNFIKKEALARVFSCEFCEIFKNTFFTKHLSTTASVIDMSGIYTEPSYKFYDLLFWFKIDFSSKFNYDINPIKKSQTVKTVNAKPGFEIISTSLVLHVAHGTSRHYNLH